MHTAHNGSTGKQTTAAAQHCYIRVKTNETLTSGKDTHMTLIDTLRDRLAKRAAYERTRKAIASLPHDLAVEDLGIYPGDAQKIASKAVYG